MGKRKTVGALERTAMFHAVKNLGELAIAHRLPEHPGKCRNIHGHSYKVEIVASEKMLSPAGMVADFANLKALRKAIEDYDHKLILWCGDKILQDIVRIQEHILRVSYVPTVENLALDWLNKIRAAAQDESISITEIHVWEGSDSYAVVC